MRASSRILWITGRSKTNNKKWWIDLKDYDWDKVVFTNESAFKTGKKKTIEKERKTPNY